jgi:hypothetical protein
MPIEALYVLFALALICAVTFGYCLRALMEEAEQRTVGRADNESLLYRDRADGLYRLDIGRMHDLLNSPVPSVSSLPSGDIDDRLKDFSPEYGGPTKW